jgi:hypothetical protein
MAKLTRQLHERVKGGHMENEDWWSGLRMAAEIVEEEFRTTAGAIIARLRKEISN